MTLTVLTGRPVLGTALAALMTLSACGHNAAGEPRYCERNPEICAVAAILVIGGIAASDGGGGSSGGGGGGMGASDPRLKTDIQYLQTLDNGLRLYAFRYHGQEQGFVGVMADELAQDPRYAHAVVSNPDGYLQVDYDRLPVQLVNFAAMQAAGVRALADASG